MPDSTGSTGRTYPSSRSPGAGAAAFSPLAERTSSTAKAGPSMDGSIAERLVTGLCRRLRWLRTKHGPGMDARGPRGAPRPEGSITRQDAEVIDSESKHGLFRCERGHAT